MVTLTGLNLICETFGWSRISDGRIDQADRDLSEFPPPTKLLDKADSKPSAPGRTVESEMIKTTGGEVTSAEEMYEANEAMKDSRVPRWDRVGRSSITMTFGMFDGAATDFEVDAVDAKSSVGPADARASQV